MAQLDEHLTSKKPQSYPITSKFWEALIVCLFLSFILGGAIFGIAGSITFFIMDALCSYSFNITVGPFLAVPALMISILWPFQRFQERFFKTVLQNSIFKASLVGILLWLIPCITLGLVDQILTGLVSLIWISLCITLFCTQLKNHSKFALKSILIIYWLVSAALASNFLHKIPY